MQLNALLAATLLLAGSVLVAHDAQANFGQAQGFSGQHGITCGACHTPPSPTQDDAKAILDGLPASWSPGQVSKLTVRIEGGPTAMPAPQPQGGFDVSADGGRFLLDDGNGDLMRLAGDQEMTYRPNGTLQRAWTLSWQAPDLAAEPAPVHLWLAVLAANGNHVIALGLPDGGERFDSADNVTLTVPPSADAVKAWQALPLAAPSVRAESGNGTWTVAGRHTDGNATRLAWRLDGGDWQERDTAQEWTLALPGLPPGHHALDARSLGANRTSPAVGVPLDVSGSGQPAPARASPALGPTLLLLLPALVLALRRPRP